MMPDITFTHPARNSNSLIGLLFTLIAIVFAALPGKAVAQDRPSYPLMCRGFDSPQTAPFSVRFNNQSTRRYPIRDVDRNFDASTVRIRFQPRTTATPDISQLPVGFCGWPNRALRGDELQSDLLINIMPGAQNVSVRQSSIEIGVGPGYDADVGTRVMQDFFLTDKVFSICVRAERLNSANTSAGFRGTPRPVLHIRRMRESRTPIECPRD